MTNPKVKVGADLTGVQAGVSAAGKGVIDVNKQAQKAIEETRRVARRFNEEQLAAAKKLRDAIVAGGGRGSRALKAVDFNDLVNGGGTARNLSPLNGAEAERIRQRILTHLGLGGGGGAGGGGGFGAYTGGTALMAGRSVLGSVMPMGPGGSIFRHSMQAAQQTPGGSMSGAGLSRLALGGVAAAGVYGLVRGFGAARARIGSAEDEAGSYADTLRRVGGTAKEFDNLRESVRGATAGLGLAYNESARLAAAYAHEASLPANERAALGREVGTGATFSRAYGLDPGAGVGFLASMRHLGVTNSDKDGRKLAGQIGEVVAASGSTSRMGEVLHAIEAFTESVAARTLQAGNVSGMLGMTASLAGLGIKGFTADRAAGLAGALDHGFAGGAGGEAGDNLLLSVLSKASPDINALDLAAVKEAGYFGGADKVFGPDAPATRLAVERGDQAEVARRARIAKALNGKGSFGDMAMDGVMGHYGSTQSGIAAVAAMFGVSEGQASAAQLARLNGGGALNPNAKLAAPEKSEGDKTRDSISGLGNTMQLLAASAVPLLTAIRDGVVRVAEKFNWLPTGTLDGMKVKESTAVLEERLRQAASPGDRQGVLQAELDRATKDGMPQSYIDGLKARMSSTGGATGDWSTGKSAPALPDWLRKIAADNGMGDPFGLAVVASVYDKESSSGKNARTSVDGAEGGFQVMPGTYRDMMGTNGGRGDKVMNAMAGVRYLSRLRRKAGDDARLIGAGYIGGEGAIGDGRIVGAGITDGLGTSREAYGDAIERRVAATLAADRDAQLPPGSPAAMGAPLRAEVSGTFQLHDQRGRKVADPIFVATRIGAPAAAGAAR